MSTAKFKNFVVSLLISASALAAPAASKRAPIAAPPSPAPAPGPVPDVQTPQIPQAEPFTLTKALEMAFERRSEVAGKQERYREIEADVSKAWGSVFPGVTANVNLLEKKDSAQSANTTTNFEGQTYNDYVTNIVVTQPIIQGGLLWGGVELANSNLNLADINVKIAQRDLASQVIKAFYDALLADTQFKIYVRGEKVREEIQSIARYRYNVGNERELAVLSIQTDLQTLRPQTIIARSRLVSAVLEFARLVGETGTVNFRLVGTLDPPPGFEKLQERLRKEQGFKKLEIDSQEAQVTILQAQKLVTMASHWPSLNAVGQIGHEANSKGDLFSADTTAWYAGVQISIPLFSGLTSFADRRILASQEAQLRIAERSIRDDAAAQLAKAGRSVDEAKLAVMAAEAAMPAAERAVPVARRNYNLGVATYTEMSDAERNLLAAELAVEQFRHDYITAMVDYFVAAGWPIDELVASLPKVNSTPSPDKAQ